MKIPREHTALHEAAHVVLCLHFGFDVESVTIRRDVPGGPCVRLRGPVDLGRLEQRAIMTAAGMAAEVRVWGSHNWGLVPERFAPDGCDALDLEREMEKPTSATGDLAQLAIIAQALKVDSVSEKISGWIQEAGGLLARYGEAYSAVYDLLIERGTVTGAEIVQAAGDHFIPNI
jgi:hypothetical protein